MHNRPSRVLAAFVPTVLPGPPRMPSQAMHEDDAVPCQLTVLAEKPYTYLTLYGLSSAPLRPSCVKPLRCMPTRSGLGIRDGRSGRRVSLT